MLEAGQTLDISLPAYLEHTARHPIYNVPLIYFKRADGSPTLTLAFRGVVNQTGQIACSRVTDTGISDVILTFDMHRFMPVPGFWPGMIPPQ